MEETFIYENLDLFADANALIRLVLPTVATELNQHVYKHIRKSSFKKTEFALTILSTDNWQVPKYIVDGLVWLEQRLTTPAVGGPVA